MLSELFVSRNEDASGGADDDISCVGYASKCYKSLLCLLFLDNSNKIAEYEDDALTKWICE